MRHMKLIAVRHGETAWNVERREMGQMDSPLTPNGIAQAHALAQRLSQVPFQVLYTSGLGRALQTAEIIGKRCGRPPIVKEGLLERHMGIFQGLILEEIRDQFPLEREAYERDRADYVIPGGESARQRLERSVRHLTDLAAMHENDTVIAVTHGGVLMGFFEHVLGLTVGHGARFWCYNGSVNTFEYRRGKWALETWNDISHLYNSPTLHDPSVQATAKN